MGRLPESEFQSRINRLHKVMARENIDIFVIYGDEYRRENLRYVSNYWPIFERGILVVGIDTDPVLLVSPECEHIAREMSAWQDMRPGKTGPKDHPAAPASGAPIRGQRDWLV